MIRDPQQELFTALLTRIGDLGYDLYDTFLPPDGTPYPFIYLADSQQIDTSNKSAVFGSIYQTIHVWHNDPKKRGTVSTMLLAVKQACQQLEHTENFCWVLQNTDQRILTDTTTNQPLLHGILEVEYRFS